MMEGYHRAWPPGRPVTAITEREFEVVMTVARTGSNRAAAQQLGVTLQTIKNTLHKVYDKLDVAGLGQAVYVLQGDEYERARQTAVGSANDG
jgi:ATP/maltotriose-dependent transcriptional regulator MalT